MNPAKYCSDELDRRIIDHLIEHHADGTTKIAKALGLKPESGRHIIGKRLEKMRCLSEADTWHILTFHPERKEGKFRAWWLTLEDIDIEAWRKSRVRT